MPGEFHGQRRLAGCSPQGHTELDTTEVTEHTLMHIVRRLPRWHTIRNLPASAGEARDLGSIPGLGRPPGEGKGHPLQYRNGSGRMTTVVTVVGAHLFV